jgi:hypothetical protein
VFPLFSQVAAATFPWVLDKDKLTPIRWSLERAAPSRPSQVERASERGCSVALSVVASEQLEDRHHCPVAQGGQGKELDSTRSLASIATTDPKSQRAKEPKRMPGQGRAGQGRRNNLGSSYCIMF